MRPDSAARRVVVVVLDGLRPDAIDRFALPQLSRLIANGAYSAHATTVSPSVTTAAMTSLVTGVSPAVHGLAGDRVFIPRPPEDLIPLPEILARHGIPSTAYMAQVPRLFRGLASRIGRRLGLSGLYLTGTNAADVLSAARSTLNDQRRGLILLHWPDADRAGHAHGWMSPQYADACRRLDVALRMLCGLAHDPDTLLIALADHGGGGVDARDHDSTHALDRTIPLLLSGAGIGRTCLPPSSLLDVPPTILHALGVAVPEWYEGRVLHEAFARHDAPESAVA
jgi:predicted AlkP superfamily pyrophosphatase or phosphodiesterase